MYLRFCFWTYKTTFPTVQSVPTVLIVATVGTVDTVGHKYVDSYIYILYNICHPVRVDLAYHILTCSITSPIRPYAHGNCCADIATESTPAGTNIAVSSHSILHYIQSILITPTVPTVPTVSTVATISTV